MQRTRATIVVLVALAAGACADAPVVRTGPAQQRVVARTYDDPVADVRAKILAAFDSSRETLPPPFREMTAAALTPPSFSPDWLVSYVDPGGYLDAYKGMPATERTNDVLIQDPTSDLYWESEYQTAGASGRPVRFRCGFIVHLALKGPRATEAEVYELVPSVWVGEHWAFSAHGIGVGRYHDIRFVEPTVTDRIRILDRIDRILEQGHP